MQHKTMTEICDGALAAAFSVVGVDSVDVELDVAIARFLNRTNNDVERLKKRVDRAIELAGKVHETNGANGAHAKRDLSRQTVEDEKGHIAAARNGHCQSALSSSPNRDGVGHLGHAGNGQAPSSRPVREPSTAQLRASATVANLVARTVLDRTLTSDGRRWGDVHFYELAGMRRDGALARGIIGCLGPLNDKQKQMQLRDLIRPDLFEEIKARADD